MSRAALNANPAAGMVWKILSVALVRQGKEALPALRSATELMPDDAEAHSNLGAALRGLARWTEAAASYRRALEIQPNSVYLLTQAADTLSAAGKTREALPFYREALKQNPGSVDVHNNLGNALFELGQFSEAVECYQRALQIKSDVSTIHSNLGNALRELGRPRDAVVSARQAIALDPSLKEAHNNLGLALASLGEFEEAQSAYRRALEIDSNFVDALNNLGNVLRDLGERRESLGLYARAIQLDPSHAESHCNLGNVLLELRRIDEAAASYRRALVLKPHYVAAHLSLAMALRMLGLATEAEASCQTALTIDPDDVDALSLLGELFADRGEFAEAQESFDRAIAVNPEFPSVYFNIAMHRKMTGADTAWLQTVEALVAKRLPLRHEISLRYALGKYHDDTQHYDRAFDNYRLANELTKRTGLRYDGAKLTEGIDQIIDSFDASSLSVLQSHANVSECPVFIVGMPRSGTSLTEQILASHPAIFGAGELSFWENAFITYRAAGLKSHAGANLIPGMAVDYLARLSEVSRGALRVVDKMPSNFMNLGLIHAAFPHARIIHMRRHPIDTCLSIYFQYFLNTHPYGNDLDTLTHYYREYVRLMNHWRRCLPATALLEVPYESLVEDQELWTRRIVDFVGLPWDRKCLDFHETNRVVITASKWQVRQKIHTASAGRWRNYENFVGPLLSLI